MLPMSTVCCNINKSFCRSVHMEDASRTGTDAQDSQKGDHQVAHLHVHLVPQGSSDVTFHLTTQDKAESAPPASSVLSESAQQQYQEQLRKAQDTLLLQTDFAQVGASRKQVRNSHCSPFTCYRLQMLVSYCAHCPSLTLCPTRQSATAAILKYLYAEALSVGLACIFCCTLRASAVLSKQMRTLFFHQQDLHQDVNCKAAFFACRLKHKKLLLSFLVGK